MEFYHLRSFVVVADTGNLTLAAKQLCSTPPAISAHIKVLEDELKTSLFTRSTKGMALTAKGELLLTKAKNTLDSAVDMVNLAVENQHEIIGNFNLSINQSVSQLKVSELIANLTENCPGVSLEINSMATGKTIEAIREGRIDGGYIYGDIPKDFSEVKIKQQKITTIAPAGIDLDAEDLPNKLGSQTWISMGGYCPFDHMLKAKLGPNIDANVKSADDGTRLELVQKGFGLSFLEEDECKGKHGIKVLPQLDFSTDLNFVIAKQRVNEPVIRAILQEIRILWNIAL